MRYLISFVLFFSFSIPAFAVVTEPDAATAYSACDSTIGTTPNASYGAVQKCGDFHVDPNTGDSAIDSLATGPTTSLVAIQVYEWPKGVCGSGYSVSSSTGYCAKAAAQAGTTINNYRVTPANGFPPNQFCAGGTLYNLGYGANVCPGGKYCLVDGTSTGQACPATSPPSTASAPSSTQPNTTGTGSSGDTAGPAAPGQSCGTFNGSPLCVQNVPDTACQYGPGGSYVCGSAAPSSSEPQNSQAQPQTPEFTVTNSGGGSSPSGPSTVTNYNVFGPSQVSNSPNLGGGNYGNNSSGQSTAPSVTPGTCKADPAACGIQKWLETPAAAPSKTTLPTQDLGSSVNTFSISVGTATCPNPIVIPYGKSSFDFSFKPMCSFASEIQPLVISAAYILAAFIILGISRRA